MGIIDWIYPKHCPVCLDALPPGDRLICAPCRKKIRYVRGAVCYLCGKPLKDAGEEFCRGCRARRPSYDGGLSYAEYSSKYIRRMLYEVKYHRNRQLLDFPCADFAERIKDRVRWWQAEALIPVPVHPSKRLLRGYNQAEEIAKWLSKPLGVPVDASMLRRTGKTRAQKELTAEARLRNLSAAFAAGGNPKGYRRVILVDDIVTTGSTAIACANALKGAGVRNVYLLSMAIGRDE